MATGVEHNSALPGLRVAAKPPLMPDRKLAAPSRPPSHPDHLNTHPQFCPLPSCTDEQVMPAGRLSTLPLPLALPPRAIAVPLLPPSTPGAAAGAEALAGGVGSWPHTSLPSRKAGMRGLGRALRGMMVELVSSGSSGVSRKE